eukprot:11196620-Lingulodinium_polyedra.AAC.1
MGVIGARRSWADLAEEAFERQGPPDCWEELGEDPVVWPAASAGAGRPLADPLPATRRVSSIVGAPP